MQLEHSVQTRGPKITLACICFSLADHWQTKVRGLPELDADKIGTPSVKGVNCVQSSNCHGEIMTKNLQFPRGGYLRPPGSNFR